MYGVEHDFGDDAVNNVDSMRDCFIIVSRSLTNGGAGYHLDCTDVVGSQLDEIRPQQPTCHGHCQRESSQFLLCTPFPNAQGGHDGGRELVQRHGD